MARQLLFLCVLWKQVGRSVAYRRCTCYRDMWRCSSLPTGPLSIVLSDGRAGIHTTQNDTSHVTTRALFIFFLSFIYPSGESRFEWNQMTLARINLRTTMWRFPGMYWARSTERRVWLCIHGYVWERDHQFRLCRSLTDNFFKRSCYGSIKTGHLLVCRMTSILARGFFAMHILKLSNVQTNDSRIERVI